MGTKLVCFLIRVLIVLSQVVNGLLEEYEKDDLNCAISNHPIIKQLVALVDALIEKDKRNTEIIKELRAQMERCNNEPKQNEDAENITEIINLDKTRNSSELASETDEKSTIIQRPKLDEKSKYTKENGKSRIRHVGGDEHIAFFAKSTSHNLHLGPHQNILFEAVDTNIGNAFNSHHGIFVAPVSSTYVFSATILAFNAEIWTQFAVNEVPIAYIYARGTDGRHDSGSQMIIVTLNQGDDVAVQSVSQDESIYGGNYTTFSGFLLKSTAMEVVGLN